MDKVYINDKKIELHKNTPLKKILEKEGLFFPCGGKQICGRCRIICQELKTTYTDKKFLSQNQIEKGMRIACDKISQNNIKIYFQKDKNTKPQKLEYCNILVDIDSQNLTIGILEEGLVETVRVDNTIESAKNKTYELRSILAKQAIELFEKYQVAKAETFAISMDKYHAQILTQSQIEKGGETLDAPQYMLPGESLYILPFTDGISAKIFSLATNKVLPLIIMHCQKTFTMGLFTDEENYIIQHDKVFYQKEELIALRASLDLLLKKTQRPPIVSVYGDFAKAMDGVLDDLSFAIEETIPFEIMAELVFKNRMRAKIFKLTNKSTQLQPEQTDEWQQLFLSANNRYNRH